MVDRIKMVDDSPQLISQLIVFDKYFVHLICEQQLYLSVMCLLCDAALVVIVFFLPLLAKHSAKVESTRIFFVHNQKKIL